MQLNDKELESLRWLTLALSLPKEGVANHFDSEPAALTRFIQVRWPDGPICIRCQAASPTWISSRTLFQCRHCRHQFSVTTGTFLHRTRLPLSKWFRATESLIRFRVAIWGNFHMPAQALAEELDIEYVAARRTRKLILAEITRSQTGILLRAVCVQDIEIPTGIKNNSNDHLAWLVGRYFGK